MQDAAGIVTAILTALIGSTLAARVVHPLDRGQVRSALPIDAVLTAQVVVRKRADQGLVICCGQCTDPQGKQLATAVWAVVAPTTPLAPEHRWSTGCWSAAAGSTVSAGVVHPCSAGGVRRRAGRRPRLGLVLFAPEAELRQVATTAKLPNLSGCRMVVL